MNLLDFPARGKILRIEGDFAVFNPANSTYELHLAFKKCQPPAISDHMVSVIIRAKARKVWTVPSGGNFVTPIFGTPKIIQGRIKYLDDSTMVVQAGVPIIISLPKDDKAYDLINGPLVVPSQVNATIFPGATLELAPEPAKV